MGSAVFVSPFEKEEAAASIDVLGDFVGTMRATGKDNILTVQDEILFPHSLGSLYTAATQYLGFPKYGDEYKVMGLAAYGEPEYLDAFRKIINLKRNGGFELSLDYFLHYRQGVAMAWNNGEPVIGPLFSDEWVRLLGPARQPGEADLREASVVRS